MEKIKYHIEYELLAGTRFVKGSLDVTYDSHENVDFRSPIVNKHGEGMINIISTQRIN